MAVTSSQLSSFSAIHRKFSLQQRSLLYPTFRPQKSWVLMSVDGRGGNTTSSQIKTTQSCTADESKPYVEGTTKSYPTVEEEHAAVVVGTNERVQEDGVSKQKGGAKIHDFCFGIPYGGLVLSGGLIGLTFSRNPATFRNIIIGGALLTLSTFSLKTWRQGKSCLPHILGQTVLSAILLWKNFETYTLTKKLIPAVLYAAISAAMLCFYSYVVLSGGNPPPKRQKSPAVIPS